MKLTTDNIQAYLEFDDVVSINSAIRTTVDELTTSLGEVGRARSIFEWVRDEIPHSKDIGVETVSCSSVEAFTQGTGICFPKAHLLASMMRYAGIPCGFCYQVFENPLASEDGERALHGLNAIYLDETEAWHRIDPRGNRSDIRAEFSIDDEVLAFPVMKFLDDVIYPSPLNIVVTGLQEADSITSLWPKLPTAPKT